MFVGCNQAFAQYYRFAAAETASADFKSRAIAWVIAGGVVAAIAGPAIARFTQGIGPTPFALSFLSLVALGVVSTVIVSRLRLPPMAASVADADDPARPLSQIMRQPVFIVALIGSAVGFSMMSMVMTATPLAMQICGQSVGAAATVIQWHVLGMYVPSFFTGNLIRRYGVLQIMAAGVLLLGAHVAIALSGIEFAHFLSGLILLGVGWNFLFIGGTTLLTEAYRPSERARTQATHDFLMFGLVSTASLSSGAILNAFGWRAVNFTVLPFLALALTMIVWLAIQRHRRSAVHAPMTQ